MACERCLAGPTGLEGHQDLTLFFDGQPRYGQAGGHHRFMCVGCASKWARLYEGGGVFQWRRDEPAQA